MGSEKMRRILVRVLAVVVVLTFTVVTGCSASKDVSVTEADWSITIKDSSGKSIEFTDEDAGKIEMVEVEAVLVKKDGSEIDQKWKGVPLSEVLKTSGISDFSMVAVEAIDGYRQEYEAQAVEDLDTILGFFLDGQEVTAEDGLVQLVVPSMAGKFWIKNVSVIEVIN